MGLTLLDKAKTKTETGSQWQPPDNKSRDRLLASGWRGRSTLVSRPG